MKLQCCNFIDSPCNNPILFFTFEFWLDKKVKTFFFTLSFLIFNRFNLVSSLACYFRVLTTDLTLDFTFTYLAYLNLILQNQCGFRYVFRFLKSMPPSLGLAPMSKASNNQMPWELRLIINLELYLLFITFLFFAFHCLLWTSVLKLWRQKIQQMAL